MRILQIPIVGDIATPLYLGSRWTLRKRMEDMYHRIGKPINEHVLQARHHLLATSNMQRAMIRTVRRWSANRIEREASLIRCPTLIVWGDEDNHIPIREAFALRDEIPRSRLVVFRHCGHLPPTEYPEKFVEMLARFCGAESEPPAVAGG